MVKFKAIAIKGKDLKPGDLFSTAGPEYWENPNPGSIGEKVYMRTSTPLPASEREAKIYRITIEIF